MYRSVRPDGVDTTMRALRSPSISSDVMSTSTRSITSTVPFALPQPAYVAQTEAAKLLSSELDRNVALAPSALALVNDFLDHVLFTILSTSRSLSLGALRAAVPNVLKPRLGKAAIRVAEEELKEYLDEEDDVDMNTNKGAPNSRSDFDVELAWKLARLRCMVYTRLGDLEEEDEEEWLEREQLLEQARMPERLKQGDIVVGPPSAIFLTSVIEYLGEQALYYAAQHAQKRHNLSRNLEGDGMNDGASTLTPKTDDILLDGKDMNHVGRDSPLSRLWRSWRRNTRETGSRPMSPDGATADSPVHSRAGSYGRPFPSLAYQDKSAIVEARSPSQIPLPVTNRDIDEIEIPGLASAHSDSEDDAPDVPDRSQKRPISMVNMPGAFPSSFYLPAEQSEQELGMQDHDPDRPAYTRKRSLSTPVPSKAPLSSFRPGAQIIDEQLAEPQAKESEVKKEQPQVEQIADKELQPIPDDSTPDSANQSDVSPPQSGILANRRERIPSQDQGMLSKRGGMVGGAMAAAVGALGAGAAVAAASNKKDEKIASKEENNKMYEPSSSTTTQKRTVAEEMLGTGSVVPPPKDATTGASITNVADFDCMYVPMQMPSEVSPIAELDNDPMAGAVPLKSSIPTSIYNTYSADGAVPHSRQSTDKKSTPKRIAQHSELYGSNPTPVASVERSKVIVHDNNQRQVDNDGYATTTLLVDPSSLRPDSPVSPLPAVFRHETSDSVMSNTSDDAMAVRQSPLASNPVKHTHTESKGSMHSHHSKSSSSSSRLLGFTRDAQGRPQTISQQRATGGMTEDARAAHSSTPTSNGRDGRPGTANSSTSKIFGKNHKQSESADDFKKKSLEVLIQSNETLHYTLTPTTVMKEDESFITAKNRSETQDMADFIRNTGPPDTMVGRTQNPDYVPQIPTAHTTVTSTNVDKAATPNQRSVIPSSQGIRQNVSSPDRPRNPIGQPRDARPEHSSAIRDLADYARSTGPVNETQLPRALSPRPPSTVTTATALTNLQKSASTASKPANRLKFQARDPRPSRRAETSDLIDFIREGPPRTAGDHRIDRKVAPFRTTMDSEDFNNLVQPSDPDSHTKYSESSSREGKSGGPSINSQTALLANNKVTNGVFNGTKATSSKKPASIDDGRPPRTRTRVKDPYAIDYSGDEELSYGYGKPAKAPRTEESLIDFLRNTAPPPGMETQPILAAQPTRSAPPPLGERASELRSSGAREASPHLTQTGSKIDKYKPTQPTHAAHLEKSRSKPKLEARDPTAPKTGTSDLADYLKNSGPPPSANNGPQPILLSNNKQTPAEKDGGLFKMFSKRKAR